MNGFIMSKILNFLKKLYYKIFNKSSVDTEIYSKEQARNIYLSRKQDIEEYENKFWEDVRRQKNDGYELCKKENEKYNSICPKCGYPESICKFFTSTERVNHCPKCNNEWFYKEEPSYSRVVGSDFELACYRKKEVIRLLKLIFHILFENKCYSDSDVNKLKSEFLYATKMPIEILYYHAYAQVIYDDYYLKEYVFDVNSHYRFNSDYDRCMGEFSEEVAQFLTEELGIKSLYD